MIFPLQQTFRDFALQENEMVCVELVAKDKVRVCGITLHWSFDNESTLLFLRIKAYKTHNYSEVPNFFLL